MIGKQSKPLRVACVGAGYFSQFHYEAWQRIPGVELVALCDCNAETAQKTAEKYAISASFDNLENMLQSVSVDLVDVIVPPDGHAGIIRKLADHGIDAVCQKPFGRNRDEANTLTELAEGAGIELIIHENFRFMPWMRQIRGMIDDRTLGDVLNARFCLRTGDGQGADAYLDRQPYFQTMVRFLIHETAIHFIDSFRFLFGEPIALYARLRKCNPGIAGEDAGLILFDYDNGLSVQFEGNRLLDHAADNTRRTLGEMWVEGTRASLRLEGSGRLYLRRFGEQSETEVDYHWNDDGFGGDCVYLLISHISDHFLKGSPVENRARDYLRNLDIEEAVYRSDFESIRVEL